MVEWPAGAPPGQGRAISVPIYYKVLGKDRQIFLRRFASGKNV